MNTVCIISVGRRRYDLHQAVEIYELCQTNNIPLSVEWLSWDENEQAHTLSRMEDANDYSLDQSAFLQLAKCLGSHTVDCFASLQTKLLPQFCCRFLNPGCKAVDAFTVNWAGKNNWIFPLHTLSHKCFNTWLKEETETIILPEWHSAPWWPLLARQG